MDERRLARALAGLWAVLGILLLASALLFSGSLLQLLLDPWGGPVERTLQKVPGARLRLAAGGALLLGGSFIGLRAGLFRWLARRERRANLFLLATVLVTTVYGLEQLLSVRFYRERQRSTGIFLRDPDLGWKLRPDTRDVWGGVPVAINSHGLRGPEPPPPVAGQLRLLFLGDSVTFGYLVREGVPFPAQVEELLGPRLPGRRVVALNAGVDGYSPWQEDGFLARRGPELRPDQVLVCFVLNDVTEKFSLFQFGGRDAGFQLRHTMEGMGDRLAGWSSLFAFGVYLRDRVRYGARPAEVARGMERLRVMDLLYDEKRDLVDRAWEITLQELGRLFDRCRAEGIPALLVVFPYAFQLENPRAYGRPQAVLARWAAEQGVERVDLLPLLREELGERRLPITAFFLDDNHLTPEGHRTVARLLAGEIEHRLPPAAGGQTTPPLLGQVRAAP